MQTLRPPAVVPVGQDPGGSVAWLLDATEFHREFDELFAALVTSAGPAPMRARATELWSSTDPTVASVVGRLATDTPEEWEVGFEDAHLGQWYRVVMAAHLRPTRAVAWPAAVRNGLPLVGFSPAYARRLAHGRELMELAGTYGSPEVAAALSLVLGPGNKGWLDADDLEFALDRLRTLDRRAFRRHQDLVPVCEDLWATLVAATTDSNAVLVLPPSATNC